MNRKETAIISLKPFNNPRNRSERSPNVSTRTVFFAFRSDGSKKKPAFRTYFFPTFILYAQTEARVLFSRLSSQTEAGKNRFSELVSCHASLFGLKFWTFN